MSPRRPAHPERFADPVHLERVEVRKRFLWWSWLREEFQLTHPIRYPDEKLGVTITVPNPAHEFTTDLTSVPAWFTWLVPKSGAHLYAALIHDGLVHPKGEPSYTTHPEITVERIEADRVFRDAMRDARVGPVRSWLVWAAVVTASLVRGPRLKWPWYARVWYLTVILVVTLAGIVYLGTAATVDLFDREVPLLWNLPWMPEGPPLVELLGGLAGAVLIPAALSLLWLRYALAGLIVGVALAPLLHVTVAVALVAGLYQLLELVAKVPALATLLAVTVVFSAGAVFAMAMCWVG